MEATASFALKDSKISLDNHDVLKRLRQTPSLLRRLYHKHPNASQHLIMPAIWVAYVSYQYVLPVLRREVFIRCFGCPYDQSLPRAFWWGSLTNGIIKCILLRSKHNYYYFGVPGKRKNIKTKSGMRRFRVEVYESIRSLGALLDIHDIQACGLH